MTPGSPERRPQSVAGAVRAVVVAQAIAGVLVALVVVGFFVAYSTQAGRVDDRQERLLDLRDLRGDILSAESGLRGYLLVRRPAFLVPYREAFPRIDADYRDLRAESSSSDLRRLAEVRAVVEEWRVEFAEVVLLGPDRERAMALVRTGQGKRRIDRALGILSVLSATARRDIDQARTRLRAAGIVAILVFVLATVLFVGATRALSRRISRRVIAPVGDLASTAEAFGAGQFERRAAEGGLAELDLVARTFNEMAGRVAGVVEELRRLDRMKSNFVSTVSHELRTPLTSVKGYLEALTEGMAGELNDEQQEFAGIAQENVTRLEELIDDLLLLSRLGSGQAELRLAPVELRPLLERSMASFRPTAVKRGIEVRLDADEDLRVVGEELRLTQAVGNLVSNALKFSARGSVVDVRLRSEGPEAVLEVTDRGVGIPEDELDQLTERFFRASTAANVHGTGLGLAITRELVERHGGRLEVESRVGEGSTFRIRLPVDAPARAAGA